jgi:hypothetical protein
MVFIEFGSRSLRFRLQPLLFQQGAGFIGMVFVGVLVLVEDGGEINHAGLVAIEND